MSNLVALPPFAGSEFVPTPGPPLTIGYVLKMFPRFSETFILNEILELERQGVRVVIFSMKTPNERLRQAEVAAVQARVHVVPEFRGAALVRHLIAHARCLLRSPRRYWQTLHFARTRGSDAAWEKFLAAPYIVRTAQRAGVEHFHAHFASGPARQAKLAAMISGIPFSFTGHAKDLFWAGHQHGKNNKLKKRVREASFVITISDFNRDFIRSLDFRVPRRRLLTVPNGMDLRQWTFVRPLGLPLGARPEEPPLFLAVGRLVEKKGFADLVEACRILRDRGRAFRCVIAGEGPERERLAERIAAAGLTDAVVLAGAVPLAELRADLLPSASVLIQPSIVCEDGDRDGIPTVILEAMATGLPVISTPVSGIGEAVVHGVTGLLVGQRKPESLATAMDILVQDPALAARLATGGRRLVETRFNLRTNVGILIHLFRHSARGDRRWSEAKLRERLGLAPVLEPGFEGEALDAAAQG